MGRVNRVWQGAMTFIGPSSFVAYFSLERGR